MAYRSESERLQADLESVLHRRYSPEVAIRVAQTSTLLIAMEMLQAQVLSRRAVAVQAIGDPASVDQVSQGIQGRVERIRLIVAELRRRGETVEWEE